jgi:beta-galactosidase/beta-glucuronidase
MELKQSGQTVDRVESYFGMRKHSIGTVNGQTVLMLNNKQTFDMGTLDQGFWPDGIYTAPTDEALCFDIEVHKEMGFNMIRKHMKVESRRWYHWCDKLGILVWQDMPNTYTRDGNTIIPPTDTEVVIYGLQRMVLTHRNTPSIVQWIIFNEGQAQMFFDTEKWLSCCGTTAPRRARSTRPAAAGS